MNASLFFIKTELSKILRIKGEVVPVSFHKNNLVANLDNGKKLVGESNISDLDKKFKIESLGLQKKVGAANSRAVEVINNADIIIFGPGGLYHSIIPNLLFPSIRDAINSNKKAKKILVPSVMSQGNTYDYSVSDFKVALEKHLEGKLTHLIANTHVPVTSALQKYRKEDKHPIPVDFENIKGVKLVTGNFIDEDKLVRHNPQKIAKAILGLL